MNWKLDEVRCVVKDITCTVFGTTFFIRVERDCKNKRTGRIFIQLTYKAPCTKTGEIMEWKGRKWYLSEHMTSDEIVKTCYAAFEAAVKHEVMEGFKIDGIVLFNPHIHYLQLLKVSHNEIKRNIHPF